MSTINNTYYENYADLLNAGKEENVRKLSTSSTGETTVINAGDEKIFKAAQEKEMGKDQFLNLLVAQLQYQDPLKPAEDTQFVAQLAQFSQLEFTQNSSQAISQLASNMQDFMDMQMLQAQSITNSSATPLLGKFVRVMDSEIDYSGVGSKEFDIHLMEGNRSGMVVISDSDGNVIREINTEELENSEGGDVKVVWDGKDADGQDVKAGKYTIEVKNYNGLKNGGYAYSEGTVTGVSFSGSGAALKINDRNYGLGYLVSVTDEAA